MAQLPVLLYPDSRLRQVAAPVSHFDAALQQKIDDMLETLFSSSNNAGYAAPQLNIHQRIVVINKSRTGQDPLCLINPEIVDKTGEVYGPEACLSVPGDVYEKVKRAEVVQVKALDRDGKTLELEAGGFLAICIQHEIDHLNGILFIDHLSALKRERIDKRLAKYHRDQQSAHS